VAAGASSLRPKAALMFNPDSAVDVFTGKNLGVNWLGGEESE
jgi:hypothetical protein